MLLLALCGLTETTSRQRRWEQQQSTSAMLFAGKRLNQEIAWQGPIVMTDDMEMANTMSEIRGGFFPMVRVDWDYKGIATKPINASSSDGD